MKLKIMMATCLSSSLLTSALPIQAQEMPDSIKQRLDLAQVLVQRCQAPDIILDKTSGPKSTNTPCIWRDGENANMSITLKLAKDIDFVVGHCTFIPDMSKNGKIDKIYRITADKSGDKGGSTSPYSVSNIPLNYQISRTKIISTPTNANQKAEDITVIFRNFNIPDFITKDDQGIERSQINLIFAVNALFAYASHNANNKLTCTFAPIIPPENK